MEQYKKQVFANFSGWTDLVMAHLTKLRTLKILNLNYQSDYASVGGAPEANGSRRVCVSVSFREIVVLHISAIDEN